MSDNRLSPVKKARQGDIEAFSEIFEPLRGAVYSLAYRIVGPDDAEDVVMDTYLKAWRAMPKFRERSSVKTWLYRIAHNCAVDRIRQRQRRKEISLVDRDETRPPIDPPDEDTPAPDEAAERSDVARDVDRAMAMLSDDHRAALMLRYADGMSYREIAAATGVSIGTVMSRLFSAKRKLRKTMEEGV